MLILSPPLWPYFPIALPHLLLDCKVNKDTQVAPESAQVSWTDYNCLPSVRSSHGSRWLYVYPCPHSPSPTKDTHPLRHIIEQRVECLSTNRDKGSNLLCPFGRLAFVTQRAYLKSNTDSINRTNSGCGGVGIMIPGQTEGRWWCRRCDGGVIITISDQINWICCGLIDINWCESDNWTNRNRSRINRPQTVSSGFFTCRAVDLIILGQRTF